MDNAKINLDLFNKSTSQSSNTTQTDSLSIGIIIAILVMIAIFVLIAVNNIWVFIVASVLITGYLIYDQQYKVAIIFAIMAILITVWQFLVRPKVFKTKCRNPPGGQISTCPSEITRDEGGSGGCPSDTVENFYTLFTPYQREADAMESIDTTALSSQATKLWKARQKDHI